MGTPFAPVPVSELITVSVACKKQYLGLSRREVARLCADGFFKTAFKGGTQGKTSKWQIARTEVLNHRLNGHANPLI